jgi:hypothetical protein
MTTTRLSKLFARKAATAILLAVLLALENTKTVFQGRLSLSRELRAVLPNNSSPVVVVRRLAR